MKKIQDRVYGRWIIFSLVSFAVMYSLNSFLISPAVIMLSNDIVYADTPLPMLLEYLGELFETVAISVSYAALIAVMYIMGYKRVRPIFVIFCIGTVYKYLANTFMSWVISGSIPLSVIWDIINVVYFSALELLQLFVIYLVIRPIIIRCGNKSSALDKANCGEELRSSVYPFNKLYDKENCLLKSAYLCALVTFIAKLGGAFISDAWSMILYGLPEQWYTWLLMAVAYLSKAVFAVIVYFTVYIALSSFLKPTK